MNQELATACPICIPLGLSIPIILSGYVMVMEKGGTQLQRQSRLPTVYSTHMRRVMFSYLVFYLQTMQRLQACFNLMTKK